MNVTTLRGLVEAIVVIVFFRHLQGASRTFSQVKGERPALLLRLFPFAYGIIIYTTFTAAFHPGLVIPGLIVVIGALVLFEWARHSVRGRFFSYAYSHDTPEFLWTSGPFAYIRNPFYTSYLLSYAGAAILFPAPATFVVLGLMILFFLRVAQHEERKFQNSALSADYEAYCHQAGRFVPKLKTLIGDGSAKET